MSATPAAPRTASRGPAGSATAIPLVFAHANSFPAGTYRQLIALLESNGYAVFTVDKFGHDPRYPVTDQWPHLVTQLHDCVQRVADETSQQPFLVGHSLGGILSLMCAAQHPEFARGVVLLDSPVPAGWRARALRVIKRHAVLRQRFMPSAVSAKRRTQWASREQALRHFESKRAFARWDTQVLHDYLQAGFDAHDSGGVALSFDRAIESRICDTLPHNLGQLLRRQPLQCPLAFVGGTRSRELRQMGMSGIRRVPQLQVRMVDGSHLFPMEKPAQTVAVVCELLAEMAAGTAASGPQ